MKKIIKVILIIVLILIGIFAGILYFRHQALYPSTDDAYVQAHIANIAPQVSGKVQKVFVQQNQMVKQGQILFTIDPTSYRINQEKANSALANTITKVHALESAVNASQADVAAKLASQTLATSQYKRTLKLFKEKIEARAQLDNATSSLHQAQAAYRASLANLNQAKQQLGKSGDNNALIQQAKAALDQANLDLLHTRIYAPNAGMVSNLSLRPGDEVSQAQNLFAIIETNKWWAQANLKETQLKRIKPGQPATIKIDMYPDQIFKGMVESISYGSGDTFALLPAENATGNWVKVTQRFPVKVWILPDSKQMHQYPLRVGSSCLVTINTNK